MNARTVQMALRGTSAVLAVLAAVQVLLAGSFLSGHYPVLRWHMITGFSMVVIALVQTVAVFLPGRRDRPPSLLRTGIMVPIVLAVQGILGQLRILELHVPIGVAMVIGLSHMASWAWRTPLPSRTGPGHAEQARTETGRAGIRDGAAGIGDGVKVATSSAAAAGRGAAAAGRGAGRGAAVAGSGAAVAGEAIA